MSRKGVSVRGQQRGHSTCIRAVPELRIAVLRGGLPDTAYGILSNDLPRFYGVARWDLNRRILMCLASLYREFPNDTAVRELHLSEDEVHLVVFGKSGRQSKIFDWF
jgi:hypothetical protein